MAVMFGYLDELPDFFCIPLNITNAFYPQKNMSTG
jgi:hypothetical protein